MKKRTSSLPLLVLVAVVALVIGSFGTAQAAGLSKQTVKKIATKVVNKKAPTLSVAFATNAGNATTLNGQPASAYQTKATKFALPVATAVSTRTYTFTGLAAGTYEASFSVEMSTSDAAPTTLCILRGTPGGPNADIFRYGDTPGNGFATLTGSAVVTVGATAPTLVCSTFTGTFSINPAATTGASSASFVNISTVTNGTAVGSKPAGGAGGADAR